MSDRREEPLLGGRFRVEIDGLRSTAVTEVTLPEARIEAGEGHARPAGQSNAPRAVRDGPLTLKRALSASSDWYEWWEAARSASQAATKRVVVVVLDGSLHDVQRWTFTGTQPVAYSVSPLNAARGEVLIETLELSIGGLGLTSAR